MPHVSFQPGGLGIDVPPGSSVLDAALAAGLPIARSCGAHGLCGRCAVRVVAGSAELEPESAEEGERKRRNRVAADLRLACLTRVRGDLVITASYW